MGQANGGADRRSRPSDVRSEQVSLVVKQLPLVLVANLANPVLTVMVLAPVVRINHAILWAGLLIGLTAIRFVQLKWLSGSPSRRLDPDRMVAKLTLASGVSGLIWGIGLVLLMPDPLIYRMFVAFVLGGMAAGSVATLSPLMPVVTAFLAPCMLPLVVRLGLEGSPVYLGMAVLGIVFTGGLWTAAWKLNGWIREMLLLKLDKIQLAEELSTVLDNLERQVEQRTADLRIARDEADRANLAKTRFLAAASHDMGQPLQAMRLFIDLLDTRLAGTSNHELVRNLMKAHISGERMLAGLLDLSRLETGTVQVRLESFSVDDLLEELGDEFRPLAGNRGLTLTVRHCDGTVLSDPVLLHQIIANLLANAVRYTAEGKILLGCRRRGVHIRIEVWDTGIGIPADRLDDIFEEFRRIDQVEQTDFRGVGLGLSIVRRTAALLDHPVTVCSRPDHGSMFAITVPLGTAEAPKPPP
ncbi:HAMP domain-containing histidine kinase [Skermanella mucosa]|uniref:sensor histidine kinase n=1 Tax=Skermanella mucosa TaxID=1789672 RepID=UPI00192B2117|nr:HAMP domain-containing sensor histidine kinase [Skermanella mucosa]UEM23403.1 HAMP domain-containing histidine kinase [Skermanella mucosa]